jgi:hypothetical protein
VPVRLVKEPALQFAEKLFFRSFRTKKPSQVIESSFVEMTEITKLVPFSANCFSRAAASLCLSRAAAPFVLAAGVSPRCDATI